MHERTPRLGDVRPAFLSQQYPGAGSVGALQGADSRLVAQPEAADAAERPRRGAGGVAQAERSTNNGHEAPGP